MKIDLYEWYGRMKADSGLYSTGEIEGDERAHAYLEIDRGADQVNVWIYTIEEAQAIIDALVGIRLHLEDQAQEAP